MVSTDNLMREIEHLRDENARLRDLLRAHGIPLPATAQGTDSTAELKVSSTPVVTKGSPMTEKAALFLSLFQGRRDVYARRWEGKNGRAGYSPACRNEWKPGVCLKPKGKCAECAHAEYTPLTRLSLKRTCVEKLCWAFIRCFRMKSAVSSPLILMKKAGARTSQ